MTIKLFLRHKVVGENSIEELANVLCRANPDIKLVVFPTAGRTLKEIIANIRFARENAGDINHFFSSSDSIVIPFVPGIKIVTWHDVGTAFMTRNKILRVIKKYVFRYVPLLCCDAVTCISCHTFNEMVQTFPLVKNRLKVIYNPYNPILGYTPKMMGSPVVILHIGTAPRKNLERVTAALQGLDCRLLIVGKLNARQKVLLKDAKICYWNTYDIDYEEIVELYKQADIISFPSLYEGFGMPVIEGQVIGRPVLTSREGSIPEVARSSVCYVNPYDVEDIRAGFISLMNDHELYSDIVKKGRRNAARFNIETISSQYKTLYEILSDKK